MDLILSDGNGNTLRDMGYFSSTLAFSPDGSLLATGCRPSDDFGIVSEICILDVNKFSSTREQITVGVYDTRYPIASKVALPEQCLEYQYRKGEPLKGVFSIDWSPKADRLILVCGKPGVREVCIVPLDGIANCWNDNASKDVFRATWSPVDENAILVTDWQYPESKIYLVDPSGERLKYIADGGSPTWSPDGKQIAYVESAYYPDTANWSYGIASINIDGSNHRWLYKPIFTDVDNAVDLRGIDSGRPTRLAWSPDGRFIVFSGVNGYLYNFRIFRLNISTGNITILMDPGIFSHIVTEPDWGP
jgi:Tol biopolymer transport system component